MQLRDLGIKVLKLPKHVIDTALYNHRTDIREAAQDVVSTWRKQQQNQQDVFNILHAELEKRIQQVDVLKTTETAARISEKSKKCKKCEYSILTLPMYTTPLVSNATNCLILFLIFNLYAIFIMCACVHFC